MRAIWKNVVLAESSNTIVVERNHYFPPESIRKEYFRSSNTHTTCFWKGVANYYDIVIGNEINRDAAWYYPETMEEAKHIKGYVAFWKGVEVVK
ncbi:MAG TPA: DUF427 domain-containing protein [Thermodesulfobacteriota bacterium]|jgi:uncharacterized protein (DUF427 family)